MVWLTLIACGNHDGDEPITGDGVPAECADGATYPEGAVEPMALGEVLTPYSWPVAIDRATGQQAPLDLADVPCGEGAFDWSRAAALLFVSIPAW